MTKFIGVIKDAGGTPFGRIIFGNAGPDNGGIVTGSVVVGDAPTALTGFHGLQDGASITASGSNTVSNDPDNPFDDLRLVVDVTGTQTGSVIDGVIMGGINPQSPGDAEKWTYHAIDINRPESREAIDAAGVGHEERDPKSFFASSGDSPGAVTTVIGGGWSKIPKVAKVAAVIAAVALVARKLR